MVLVAVGVVVVILVVVGVVVEGIWIWKVGLVPRKFGWM